MQHTEKTLKPVADAPQRSAASDQWAAAASIHNSPRVVGQRQPPRSFFGDALQLQVGLENEAPAQTQAPVQLNWLQAAIDRSPRMLAQRRALDAAFGRAIQCETNALEDEEPLQARTADGVGQGMAADEDEEALLQGCFEGAAVQRIDESAGSGDLSAAASATIAAPVNDTGMPSQLKAGIESLSSMDMSDVRVHRNSDKPAQLNALAYAQGSDIHLGPGQEQHLPHEAWHVVQQRQGRVRETVQMARVGVNDELQLEREADVMGGRAVSAGGAVAQKVEGNDGSLALPPSSQKVGQPRVPGAVSQRVAWHQKALGSAGVNDAQVPPITGLVNNNVTATFDIGGMAFTGPQYDLATTDHADKTTAVVGIASQIGALQLPGKNKLLKVSQFNLLGFQQTQPNPNAILNNGHKNIYKGGIDPFLIRAPATYGAGATAIALNYQFGVASYGYIVKIEQEGGTFPMHAARGQEALGVEQTSKLKSGLDDDPSYGMFASGHDTDSPGESIATVANKSTVGQDTAVRGADQLGVMAGPLADDHAFVTENLARLKEKSKRLDAVTKLGGEGPRFICVRTHAAQLSNDSRFYTADPDDGTQSLCIDFQTLWGIWDSKFNCAFNISDATVKTVVLENKAVPELVKRVATATLTANDYNLG